MLASLETFQTYLESYQSQQHDLLESITDTNTTITAADKDKIGLDSVMFYMKTINDIISATTSNLQRHSLSGFRSSIYVVDSLLRTLASLGPVRAVGAARYFRAAILSAANRPSISAVEWSTYI